MLYAVWRWSGPSHSHKYEYCIASAVHEQMRLFISLYHRSWDGFHLWTFRWTFPVPRACSKTQTFMTACSSMSLHLRVYWSLWLYPPVGQDGINTQLGKTRSRRSLALHFGSFLSSSPPYSLHWRANVQGTCALHVESNNCS